MNGDLLDEDNETYFVNLSNAVDATLTDDQGLGTINDDDPLPALSVGNATVTEGDAGTARRDLHGLLNVPSGRTVNVDYGTISGSASAAADYSTVAGTLEFAAGETTKTVTVLVERRPARRGGRDLHRQPLGRSERDHIRRDAGSARSPTTTRCPRSAINDVDGRRGRRGHCRRDLHGQPERRQRPHGQRQVRDHGHQRERSRRLCGQERHAQLRRG